jgi:hypothetical protein
VRHILRHNRFDVRHHFEFVVDPEAIFQRFATTAAWEEFLNDGTVIIPGIFDHLTNDPEIMAIATSEFNAYNWHYFPEGDGNSRRGWLRSMYYSLIQQAVRMDPIYYALTVAARPDKNFRLISVPYYTKDVQKGESTGFLHLDCNVDHFYHQGEIPVPLVQGSMSLDDEEEDGCTLVVKGMHKHLYEWWRHVLDRGMAKRAQTGNTNVKGIYLPKDADKWGHPEPTPCMRGGIRLTRGEIIHGSTARGNLPRRVIYPWFTGIGEDHETLDMPGAESWSQVASYHRDFAPPRKQASGRTAGTYGGQVDGLLPKLGLFTTSAISNALVGRCRWEGILIHKELSILFGSDEVKAVGWVTEVRKKIVLEVKRRFEEFVSLEKEAFQEASFFYHKELGSKEVPVPDGMEEGVDSDLEAFEAEIDDSQEYNE